VNSGQTIEVSLVITSTPMDGNKPNVLGEGNLVPWKISRIQALVKNHLGNIGKHLVNIVIRS
jgi:hypothetical protein